MKPDTALKILNKALSSGTGDIEAVSAFNMVKDGLAAAGMTFEDVIPDRDNLELLRADAKRIMALRKEDFILEVTSLQDLHQAAKKELARKDREISKLARQLVAAKTKPTPVTKTVPVAKIDYAVFIGPCWPTYLPAPTGKKAKPAKASKAPKAPRPAKTVKDPRQGSLYGRARESVPVTVREKVAVQG